MVEVVEARSSTSGERAPARRVGPGRIERGYLARIEGLESARSAERERERELELDLARSRGELAVAERLEHGLQRLLDRQEERLEVAAQREKRLALALGAVQRENELLRGKLELGAGVTDGPVALLPARREPRAAPRRGLWGRLFGRG
jgi:hypothetical protein